MRDIALTGLARSGKDSVAARLIDYHGYVRVAFADPLKEAALKADPIISACGYSDGEIDMERLSQVVNEMGWERAKDLFPEVRRFLQYFGQTIRDLDSSFWVRAAFGKIRQARAQGRPVVVTDVRYTNEADALLSAGFDIVRVERPGLVPGQHISEREMAGYPVSATIVNDDTLSALSVKADGLTSL
ncbi:hypothetical protein [Streptomyces sp. NPDC015414]|uniref:deoxynucleotide monophosphate kinase family protein n=1 Tax=Streptomyces sp. NPDC015414 TaxID=3364957 RepID=UPI0036FF9806